MKVLSHRDGSSTDLVKSCHQTSAAMASMTLPEELIDEILLRIPPDDPAHLVHASLVCKAWHSIISDDTFRRRYRRFQRTPTLQGYFYNDFTESTIQFVPTNSMAVSTFCVPKDDNSSSRILTVLDCRHGRVLICQYQLSLTYWRLVVWDPIAGSQEHLSLPAYRQHPYSDHYCVAAVLCANKGCDHIDCHSGPFLVVFVVSSYNFDGEDWQTRASVYSSETGAWSASMTPNVKTHKHIHMTPSLLIGDALYFNTLPGGYSIIKYDLCKHELSVIHLPGVFEHILIKGTNGGLGLASLLHNCINTWSWKVDNNGNGGSLQYRGMTKLDDKLLPEGDHSTDLICMAEGTSTVFIRVKGRGLFTLDLKSKQVRKIGEKEMYYQRIIVPYTSFSR